VHTCVGYHLRLFGKRFFYCKQTQSLVRAEINLKTCPKCEGLVDPPPAGVPEFLVKIVKTTSIVFLDLEKEIEISKERVCNVTDIHEILDGIKS